MPGPQPGGGLEGRNWLRFVRGLRGGLGACRTGWFAGVDARSVVGGTGFVPRIWFFGRRWRAAGAGVEETVEGLVELALERVFVAGQLGEGVAAGVSVEQDAEQAGVLVELLVRGEGGGGLLVVILLVVVLVLELADFFEAADEEAGLDAGEALEAPLGGGHLVDQVGFERAFRLVLGFEGGEELEVLGAVLDGEDDLAGEQAVADGVGAGAGLAFGGLGSGGVPGVFAIGSDLIFGGHKVSYRLQVSTGGRGYSGNFGVSCCEGGEKDVGRVGNGARTPGVRRLFSTQVRGGDSGVGMSADAARTRA